MAHSDDEQPDKKRLWNDLLMMRWNTTDLGKVFGRIVNPNAHAFFTLIDAAFTHPDEEEGVVTIDRGLIEFMAVWGRDVASNGNLGDGPHIGNESDTVHTLSIAFDGFIKTIRHAVKYGKISEINGQYAIGLLPLPQWIVDKYLEEAKEEAEESWRRSLERHGQP
jgi:hypothetical protein